MTPTELPPDEFKMLEQPSERMKATGTARLVINAKLLGPPHRLDNIELNDVEFVDCDFLGQFMFNVSLTNVSFTRCAIVDVRWEDGQWNNVSFTECVAQGRGNNIVPGGGSGDNVFNRCKFIGGKVPPGESSDAIRFHGSVGSAGTSKFQACTFERMNIRLLGFAQFIDCQFSSAGMESPRSEVPIESIIIEDSVCKNTMDLSTPGINVLSLRRSSFDDLVLTHCKLSTLSLEKVIGSFMFNVLDARVFSALDCTFKSPLDPPPTWPRSWV